MNWNVGDDSNIGYILSASQVNPQYIYANVIIRLYQMRNAGLASRLRKLFLLMVHYFLKKNRLP